MAKPSKGFFSQMFEDFFTKLFGECWKLFLIAIVGTIILPIIVVALYTALLFGWFNHQGNAAGNIYDPFFWAVLIFFIIPAFAGSVVLFAISVVMMVQRPNTLGIILAWQDAAYVALLGSVFLYTTSWQALSHNFDESPPRAVVWSVPLWLVMIATTVWLPYTLCSCCRLMHVKSWYGIRGEVHGEELEHLKEKVAATCQAYSHSYDFYVTIKKAYYVSNDSLEEKFDRFCEQHVQKGKPQNRRELFHGTRWSAAKSIIESGFRIPTHAGMFGKGIYFADTPLKSMQYTRGLTGAILLCEVELGNTLVKTSADSYLTPENYGERNWLMKGLFRQRSFDSVTARAGFLGAVRVPEYVVYAPDQAVPKYLIVFRQQRKA